LLLDEHIDQLDACVGSRPLVDVDLDRLHFAGADGAEPQRVPADARFARSLRGRRPSRDGTGGPHRRGQRRGAQEERAWRGLSRSDASHFFAAGESTEISTASVQVMSTLSPTFTFASRAL